MARLLWDETGERYFETGVDHGVLYPQVEGKYPKGVVWNGLSQVSESPSGAEENAIYADNMKYLSLRSAEDFGGSIECYTYPDEWMACDGQAQIAPGITIGQQQRQNFGFAYRSRIGNDTEGDALGYKLHLWYNCSASTSERSYQTVNDSPDALSFSYEITTTPIQIDETHRPSACLTIDSRTCPAEKLKALEDILYGTDEEGEDHDARLPLPKEVIEIIGAVG